MTTQPQRHPFRTHLLNPLVRILLRSRLHRLLDGSLLLLTYTGLRTGEPHTLPLQYARCGDQLVILAADGAQKRWWRSLIRPVAVELRLAGADVGAIGWAVTDDPDLRAVLVTRYLTRFPRAVDAVSGATVICLDVDAGHPTRSRPGLIRPALTSRSR